MTNDPADPKENDGNPIVAEHAAGVEAARAGAPVMTLSLAEAGWRLVSVWSDAPELPEEIEQALSAFENALIKSERLGLAVQAEAEPDWWIIKTSIRTHLFQNGDKEGLRQVEWAKRQHDCIVTPLYAAPVSDARRAGKPDAAVALIKRLREDEELMRAARHAHAEIIGMGSPEDEAVSLIGTCAAVHHAFDEILAALASEVM